MGKGDEDRDDDDDDDDDDYDDDDDDDGGRPTLSPSGAHQSAYRWVHVT